MHLLQQSKKKLQPEGNDELVNADVSADPFLDLFEALQSQDIIS